MPFHDLVGHERPKAILQAALRHDHLAHAYLFHGEPAIGKRRAGLIFAQAINCDMPPETGLPDCCGHCRSCLQIEAGTHPDFFLLEPDPEQANPQIKIEQVRELEQSIIYRPLVGRWKICLIDEADRLTPSAGNALLKTLEEPPAHSLFLLISSRPAALLPTVRSRCQGLRFASPALTQVEAALILKRELPPAEARYLAVLTQARIGEALTAELPQVRAHRDEIGAILSRKALGSVSALLAAVESWQKSAASSTALEWIGRWLRDVLLVRLGADEDALLNVDRLPQLKDLALQLSPDLLVDLLGEIDRVQRAGTRNLNLQITLEALLLRLRHAILSPASSVTGF